MLSPLFLLTASFVVASTAKETVVRSCGADGGTINSAPNGPLEPLCTQQIQLSMQHSTSAMEPAALCAEFRSASIQDMTPSADLIQDLTPVHVPKCGEQLAITLVFTHCQRLLGSCAGDGKIRDCADWDAADCAVARTWSEGLLFINGPETILRNASVMEYCDVRGPVTFWHTPWTRHTGAPMGVIVLRDPFRRALSAFKFEGGHVQPQTDPEVLKSWWSENHPEDMPASFELQGLQKWWKGNFSRYLLYPGVTGCQTQMLLGYECNKPLNKSLVNPSLAADILLQEFKYVGLTDYNALSVTLYHRMFGRKWTSSPCPQELAPRPIRATTKDMDVVERTRYLQEYSGMEATGDPGPDRALYVVARRIFLQNLCAYGVASEKEPTEHAAADLARLHEEIGDASRNGGELIQRSVASISE